MQSNSVRVLRLALSAALVLSAATAAYAQAPRTWVSGVGDDANPCSRTAPCKTFAGAISKTAAGGFIDVLDPAGYGSVTITKSITIDGGGGGVAGLITAGTNGIVVNAAGIIVHIRNLSLESAAPGAANRGLTGINVSDAAEVHVEHCTLNGFSQSGINFHPAGAGQLFVSDSYFSDNTQNAILVTTGRALIDGSRLNANGTGLAVNGNALTTVRNSMLGDNGAALQTSTNAAAVINVENCVISNDTFGIIALNGTTVRVSNSLIANTSNTALSNDGLSFIVSMQGNQVVGNVFQGVFTSTINKQ